jgi:hypothetical protein
MRPSDVMNAEENLLTVENTGTLDEMAVPLPPSVVETMKMVFRETHGGEMTPEDREFLGITDQ